MRSKSPASPWLTARNEAPDVSDKAPVRAERKHKESRLARNEKGPQTEVRRY
jgi:hypothetical protein